MMNNDEDDQQQDDQQGDQSTPSPRRRGRSVDVQKLRKKLLSKAEDYLDSTPLSELNASMVRAIADVIVAVAPTFEKEDRAHQARKQQAAFSNFQMPFPIEEDAALPQQQQPAVASKPAALPYVPVPSVK
ncbi:MAG: hypothetical protein M9907_11980 [Burkholderiaceae bacterium]|nr:hypothetical protein [Burkholderiaceae bacterium]